MEIITKYNKMAQKALLKQQRKSYVVEKNLQSTVRSKVSLDNLDNLRSIEEEEEIAMLRDIIETDCLHLLSQFTPYQDCRALKTPLLKNLVEFGFFNPDIDKTKLPCDFCAECILCVQRMMRDNCRMLGVLIKQVQTSITEEYEAKQKAEKAKVEGVKPGDNAVKVKVPSNG